MTSYPKPNSKTDYRFKLPNNQDCVVRNLPCYNHHGAISFEMNAVGMLQIIRDKMLIGELPYDVDYKELEWK